MASTIVIDPVTRLEGHLSVKVEIAEVGGTNQVINAWSTGTLFRGFEKILAGRDPWDAPHITQRICGVCPTPHALASVMALDQASRVTPPANARILRNFVLGANFVQSHILHFYHLSLLDYCVGADMPPWKPAYGTDLRLDGTVSGALFTNYVKALEVTRKIQELGAIFGGRLPGSPAYIPGGFTMLPNLADITKAKSLLQTIRAFISDCYLPDVDILTAAYDDYFGIGRGHGNLLAFGVFDLNSAGTSKLLAAGEVDDGAMSPQSVNQSFIREEVLHSWYLDSTDNLHPSSGETEPVYPKGEAYSWLKAPRYAGLPYETGPLARMWVNGDYREGISVMDRHVARANEASKIAEAMVAWLDEIQVGASVFTRHTKPLNSSGIGLTEAPRGALGHWVQISSGRISRYQIITPTCWNASPQDDGNVTGPLEEALIGTPVENPAEPVEILRVIHSFDPCLSCAVHLVDANGGKSMKVIHP